jgi:glycogen debranching enzyme
MGPFIDAWVKLYGRSPDGVRRLLSDFQQHLSDACVGSISEVFDAEPPFLPRGCIAQAWSVAEVLRCWLQASRTAAQAPAPSNEAASTHA